MFSTPIEKCNESPLHGWATIYFSTACGGRPFGPPAFKKNESPGHAASVHSVDSSREDSAQACVDSAIRIQVICAKSVSHINTYLLP